LTLTTFIYTIIRKRQPFTPIYRDYPVSERGGIHLEQLIVWPVDALARMLMEEMLNYIKKVGVDTVCTFVNWWEWGLLQFFDAMGFKRGDMINPEFKIED
jgi:hypothetical protein